MRRTPLLALALFAQAIVVAGVSPATAFAACSALPSTWPLLGTGKLEIGSNVRVNGYTVTSYSGTSYEAVTTSGGLTTAAPTFPTLDPSSFPANSSSTDTSASSLSPGSYDDVTVNDETTTVFAAGEYHIDKLKIKEEGTAQFAPGTYYIDEIEMEKESAITISPSGAVRIYINDKVDSEKEAQFNAGGSVANLLFMLYSGAEFNADKETVFTGVIYSNTTSTSKEIDFDKNSVITGALITSGTIDLDKDITITYGAAEQAAVAALSTCATSTSTTPGAFNAFETSTAASAITGVIKTKVAGSAFNLAVVALNTAGTAVETAFTGDVKAELVNAASGGACASLSAITSASTITFASGDAGRKTASFSESNAWKNLKLRLSYPATGTATTVACSTDAFAIRPNSLSVVVSDGDWGTAGTARTLNNTATSGGVVHKAGAAFTLRATGVNASGSTTSNYDGSPVATTVAAVAPATVAGTLGTGTFGAASGTATSTTASYSEAGAMSFVLEDQSFAAVDASDGSTTAERYVSSGTVTAGRFVPDHFDLATANTPSLITYGDATCASRSFTYLGQSFGYATAPQITVTAKNASGGTTQNYGASLWKLTASDITQLYSASPTLDTSMIGTPTVPTGSAGVTTISAASSDKLAFTRSTSVPSAPFNANITLTVSAADDAEAAISGNGTIGTGTSATFSDIAFDAGDTFRYGRLLVPNAYGAELADLAVPMEAQYFDGTAFVRNTADHCTLIAATNLALSGWLDNLTACESSVSVSGRLASGVSNLKITAPGAGNSGSVALTALAGSGSGPTCVSGSATSASSAGLSWLQGAWSGSLYDDNPTALITFGVYQGGGKQIYLRELY